MTNTRVQPLPTPPYLVAGFDSHVLTSAVAKEIERSRLFKFVLKLHVDHFAGPLRDIAWGRSKRDEEEAEAQPEAFGDAQAREYLRAFLLKYAEPDDDGNPQPRLEAGELRRNCRMTPSGWIREFSFQMKLAGTENIWNCSRVLDWYLDMAERDDPGAAVRQEFENLTIRLIVTDWFDLIVRT